MRSYEFIGLKALWNEQLQKSVGVSPGGGPSKTKPSGLHSAGVSCVVVDFSGAWQAIARVAGQCRIESGGERKVCRGWVFRCSRCQGRGQKRIRPRAGKCIGRGGERETGRNGGTGGPRQGPTLLRGPHSGG